MRTQVAQKVPFLVINSILVCIAMTIGCMPVEQLEECISLEPTSSGEGAGYELIDLMNKKVWVTADFTAAEYAAFSPPLFWLKNDPRIMVADGAEFLRSPGCSELGQFTYMQAYNKGFLNVVQIFTMDTPVDDQGLIRNTELEKYHILTYSAGSTVTILQSPTGERFILVARSADRTSDTFTLPAGWILTTHVLQTELQVDLSGNVSVLRTDNEDSFQGPLPDDISF